MKIRHSLYRGKAMVNIEVRDRDLKDFDHPLFKFANRVEYGEGKLRHDGFSNAFMSKFSDATLERFSKKKSRKAKERDLKQVILENTKDAMMKAIIEDDNMVDLLRGEYLLGVDKKVLKKYQNLKQALYHETEVFPQVYILREDKRFNVFYNVILKGKYLQKIKEYKNLRTYARKHFVYGS